MSGFFSSELRIAKTVACSNGANGPGKRFVIWTQGCSLGCPGCCNPDFQDPKGGKAFDFEDLIEKIHDARRKFKLTGITLTGGEPLDRAKQLLYVVYRFAYEETKRPLSIMLFTGYTEREVGPWQAQSDKAKIWNMCDIVVSGRFEQKQAIKNPKGLLASSNQKLYFPTGRLDESSMDDLPAGEVIISPDGKNVVLTGMAPGALD